MREEIPPPGFASRVAASIVVGVCWAIFVAWFLWFYAQDLGIYKTLAIVVLSLLVVGTILGPMWIYWGIKVAPLYRKYWAREPVRRKRRERK